MFRRFAFLTVLVLLILPTVLLTGCSTKQDDSMNMDMGDMKMAPLSDMPAEVHKASKTTQQSYQFAVANPDVLKQIPCYCGCGDMGHTSNYACYVSDDTNGKVTFDGHALGCSICVDITQDTMRMLSKGKNIQEIKTTIDKTYSKYGPSNMP